MLSESKLLSILKSQEIIAWENADDEILNKIQYKIENIHLGHNISILTSDAKRILESYDHLKCIVDIKEISRLHGHNDWRTRYINKFPVLSKKLLENELVVIDYPILF